MESSKPAATWRVEKEISVLEVVLVAIKDSFVALEKIKAKKKYIDGYALEVTSRIQNLKAQLMQQQDTKTLERIEKPMANKKEVLLLKEMLQAVEKGYGGLKGMHAKKKYVRQFADDVVGRIADVEAHLVSVKQPKPKVEANSDQDHDDIDERVSRIEDLLLSLVDKKNGNLFI